MRKNGAFYEEAGNHRARHWCIWRDIPDPATSAARIAVGLLLSTIPVDKSVDVIVTSGASPHSTVSIGELVGYWFGDLSV